MKMPEFGVKKLPPSWPKFDNQFYILKYFCTRYLSFDVACNYIIFEGDEAQ